MNKPRLNKEQGKTRGKKNVSPNWTRNKEKQEKKKKIVRRPAKSMLLWVAETLPLFRQIIKIDSGICFGFCFWFCSWVFGVGSGREWHPIHSPFSFLVAAAADCFESDCLREDENMRLGLELGFGSYFVVVLWVCCWEKMRAWIFVFVFWVCWEMMRVCGYCFLGFV